MGNLKTQTFLVKKRTQSQISDSFTRSHWVIIIREESHAWYRLKVYLNGESRNRTIWVPKIEVNEKYK